MTTTVYPYTKFSQREAERIMQAHVGHLGVAMLDRHHPDAKAQGIYVVGRMAAVADVQVLGRGKSYRKALEAAGVFFERKEVA